MAFRPAPCFTPTQRKQTSTSLSTEPKAREDIMTAATRIQMAARTADSTDRTPALPAARQTRPTVVARVGGAARRLLGSLMRSLATPHV